MFDLLFLRKDEKRSDGGGLFLVLDVGQGLGGGGTRRWVEKRGKRGVG